LAWVLLVDHGHDSYRSSRYGLHRPSDTPVRDCPSPPSLNGICAAVPGRKQDTVATVRELVAAGQIITKPGPNRSTVHLIPS
ncbi:hypothetical protein, partial [Micrococcus aloeverae]|uniref:hypothetical protein n=1 Tax=Micrococcus aloeverae TaxID=1391911 RepID=UPI001E3A61E1